MEASKSREIVEQYFDRVENKNVLKRKSDGFELPMLQASFYNDELLEEIGQGKKSPTFLSE